MYLAWFVIIFVPIGGIVLFWLVHILPEKIAHKRHHPQRDAIQMLCLLSLVFGGLLWPIAWLWAYTKPVELPDGLRHREARRLLPRDGREGAARESCSEHELAHLREELDAMDAKGGLTAGAQGAAQGPGRGAGGTAAPVAAQAAPAGAGAKAGSA